MLLLIFLSFKKILDELKFIGDFELKIRPMNSDIKDKYFQEILNL